MSTFSLSSVSLRSKQMENLYCLLNLFFPLFSFLIKRNLLMQEGTLQSKEHPYHDTPAASEPSVQPGTQG